MLRSGEQQGNQAAAELERKSWITSDWMLSKESQVYMTENYTYFKYAITKCQPDIKLLYKRHHVLKQPADYLCPWGTLTP